MHGQPLHKLHNHGRKKLFSGILSSQFQLTSSMDIMFSIAIKMMSHECHGLWNHCQPDCLFNSLTGLTTKLTSKRTSVLLALCKGYPLMNSGLFHWWTVDFPHKRPAMMKVFSCHKAFMYGRKMRVQDQHTYNAIPLTPPSGAVFFIATIYIMQHCHCTERNITQDCLYIRNILCWHCF